MGGWEAVGLRVVAQGSALPSSSSERKEQRGQNSWAQERKPKGHKTWLPQTQPLAFSILLAFVVLAFCLFLFWCACVVFKFLSPSGFCLARKK